MTTYVSTTDELLEQRLLDYFDMMTSYLFYLNNGDVQLTQDLVQEAALKVLAAKPDGRGCGENYFKAVVKSVWIDSLKYRTRAGRKNMKSMDSFAPQELDAFIDGFNYVETHDLGEYHDDITMMLIRCKMEMTERQWRIVSLKAEGLENAEIAEATDISVATVKRELQAVKQIGKSVR